MLAVLSVRHAYQARGLVLGVRKGSRLAEMKVEHVFNPETGKSWCGVPHLLDERCWKCGSSLHSADDCGVTMTMIREGAVKRYSRPCRNCTHLVALSKVEAGQDKSKMQRSKRRRSLGHCPRCGKLIAFVFPLHECTPKQSKKKL